MHFENDSKYLKQQPRNLAEAAVFLGGLDYIPGPAGQVMPIGTVRGARQDSLPGPAGQLRGRGGAWGPTGILGCPVSPCMSTSAPALRYPWLLAGDVVEVWVWLQCSNDAARDAMVLFLQCRGYKWPYATLEGHLRMSAGLHAPVHQTVCIPPLPGFRHARSREVNIPNRLKSAHMCTKLCVTAPAEPPPYPKPRDEGDGVPGRGYGEYDQSRL